MNEEEKTKQLIEFKNKITEQIYQTNISYEEIMYIFEAIKIEILTNLIIQQKDENHE